MSDCDMSAHISATRRAIKLMDYERQLRKESLERLIGRWKVVEQKAADAGLLQERAFATERIRVAEQTLAVWDDFDPIHSLTIRSLERDLEWFEMEMAKVEIRLAEEARAAQLEAEGDPMDID